MWRGSREKFVDQWIVGIAIIAAIIYAVITVLFWLLVIAVSCALLYIIYLITTEVEWFENRLWATILVYFVVLTSIWFGGSEILADYGKIDKSFRETAIEWAQDVKVYKSNRGNFKVTPDYENIAQNITNWASGAIVNPTLETQQNWGVFGWVADIWRSLIGGFLSPFSPKK